MNACAYWYDNPNPILGWEYENELCEAVSYITVPLQKPLSGALRVPVCQEHKDLLLGALTQFEGKNND